MSTIKLYCLCGAVWELSTRGTMPPGTVGSIKAQWNALHQDPGCGEATKDQAARARRKAEFTLTSRLPSRKGSL